MPEANLQHVTAEKLYGGMRHQLNNQPVSQFDPNNPAAWSAHALWPKMRQSALATLPELQNVSASEPALVYLNRGIWVVECKDCHHAQAASQYDHRFFCWECENYSIDGAWRKVVWPTNPDAATIERWTLPRMRVNQNWWPGETEETLRAENMQAGVG